MMEEKTFPSYFDYDLIPEISPEEVFVDLGGYIGDTVKDFVESYSDKYKKIYTYEVDEENYRELLETIGEYRDVVPRNVAAGAATGKMYLDDEFHSATTKISETGSRVVDIVSLDDDIQEKVTWIKMDIEGSEQMAIQGCQEHIRNEKPKLTICTYHSNEDIWKIPKMIKEYNEEYKLYMRCNTNTIWPSEYVLFTL